MSKNQKAVIELNNKEDQAASKIEVIKNLIFGEHIEAYDSEFELLKKDILEKKQALQQLVEEVRSELNDAIDSVSTDVNIRITELEGNLENKIDFLESEKVSKELLGKLLIDLGEKVSSK
ncbi:MAG: fructose 1,6-bisphosphatase [Bacteroidota bacterium]